MGDTNVICFVGLTVFLSEYSESRVERSLRYCSCSTRFCSVALILALRPDELALVTLAASAAPVPISVFRRIFVAVRTVGFLFVSVGSAICMSVLRRDFKMKRINAGFVPADMMNEILFRQRDTVSKLVRNSVGAFELAASIHRPVAISKHSTYPNPAAVHVNVAEEKPIHVLLIHAFIIPFYHSTNEIISKTKDMTQESGLALAQLTT